MAKLKQDPKQFVVARSVALPNWMWDVIDSAGNRSKFIRDLLEKLPAIKKAKKNVK